MRGPDDRGWGFQGQDSDRRSRGGRGTGTAPPGRPDHGLTAPVGFQAVVEVGMDRGAGGWRLGRGLVARVATGVLRVRQEPVPVQEGHVLVLTGRGVPPEQVIVVGADLAGGMMVADVVVVDLGERNANEAQDQEDPEQPQAGTGERPYASSRPYPMEKRSTTRCRARVLWFAGQSGSSDRMTPAASRLSRRDGRPL